MSAEERAKTICHACRIEPRLSSGPRPAVEHDCVAIAAAIRAAEEAARAPLVEAHAQAMALVLSHEARIEQLQQSVAEAEQRGAEKEREARIGDLVAFAAECHRVKWEFAVPGPETAPPIKCAEARRLVERAFEVLHALGDKLMVTEAMIRARGERKDP